MIDLSLIKKNQTIAVALSGGMDSMCLLHLLLDIKSEYNLTIKAINIDHSIRGKESEMDSLFVQTYCEKLEVPLKFFKVDATEFSKQNGYTLEQGARVLRYQIFDSLLSENFAGVIATAHHLSDNFETVLLNLFRGAGLKGLAGIPKSRNGYIRPLLNATKEEINNYVIKNSIPYTQDSTNFESDYARNYLRNEVVPKILDKFSSAETTVKRLSETASEEDEFLTNLASSYIKKGDKNYLLPCSLNAVLVKRASLTILKNLGVEKDYEAVNLNDIIKLLSLKNGSKITLPKGVVAVKEYDYINFYIEEQKTEFLEVPFEVKSYDFDKFSIVISNKPLENSLTFDGDKIPKNAVIRTRKDGDIFKKFGGGTKKLKDFLIDKKIPRFERDNLLVLAENNQILLVFNVEISENIKVDNNTKNKLYAKIIAK